MKEETLRESRLLTETEKRIYKEGAKYGLSLYAWWKDGVEYVGTAYTTKARAMELVDKESAPAAIWKDSVGEE